MIPSEILEELQAEYGACCQELESEGKEFQGDHDRYYYLQGQCDGLFRAIKALNLVVEYFDDQDFPDAAEN